MHLVARWPLDAGAAVRDELLAAYAHPGRGYHDTRHLTEVLDRLDELAAAGAPFEAERVRLAAWFHDGVYDGHRDAEERSAVWAERALRGLVPEQEVAAVARLVRLTETHDPADGDDDGAALCDADLGILAAGADRYADYVADVRAEYDQLDETTFRQGRAEVLARLAGHPRLFHTAHARAHWEAAARRNLETELAALRG
ncbi:MAG: hypothetical protein R2731_13865 [Nocardioides sp.]